MAIRATSARKPEVAGDVIEERDAVVRERVCVVARPGFTTTPAGIAGSVVRRLWPGLGALARNIQ
jgi:hypothetical protein